MKGAFLYLFTLLVEQISVACRFLLVFAACGPFLAREVAIALAAVAALAPLLYSLLVLAGLPSGHVLVRHRLEGRRPEEAEAEQIAASLDGLPGDDKVRPRRIYVVDDSSLNAAISGTTLFVNTGLLATKYVRPVLAHELGHLHNADGRLGLALRALVVPGAFWLNGALQGIVILLRRVLIELLNILIWLFRLGVLVRMLQWMVDMLLTTVPHTAIIFAMGGVGPRLLDWAWQSYFIGRELDADAYAATRGQRLISVELLLKFQIALADVVIPWSSRRTHPSMRQRIMWLWRGGSASERRSIEYMLHRAGYDPAEFLREATKKREQGAASWPLVIGTLALLALLAYGALAWLSAPATIPSRRPAATPTAGPTPTLGF